MLTGGSGGERTAEEVAVVRFAGAFDGNGFLLSSSTTGLAEYKTELVFGTLITDRAEKVVLLVVINPKAASFRWPMPASKRTRGSLNVIVIVIIIF